jgi:hypothetical protein
LAAFFEVGEIGFDAAEVWGVRRQEAQVRAMFTGHGCEVLLLVESGVVEDQGRVRTQCFTPHLPGPVIDQASISGAGEQHGRKKILAAPGGKETCAGTAMARVIAKDFVPTRTPAVTAADLGREPAFIAIHDVLRPTLGNNRAQCPHVN